MDAPSRFWKSSGLTATGRPATAPQSQTSRRLQILKNDPGEGEPPPDPMDGIKVLASKIPHVTRVHRSSPSLVSLPGKKKTSTSRRDTRSWKNPITTPQPPSINLLQQIQLKKKSVSDSKKSMTSSLLSQSLDQSHSESGSKSQPSLPDDRNYELDSQSCISGSHHLRHTVNLDLEEESVVGAARQSPLPPKKGKSISSSPEKKAWGSRATVKLVSGFQSGVSRSLDRKLNASSKPKLPVGSKNSLVHLPSSDVLGSVANSDSCLENSGSLSYSGGTLSLEASNAIAIINGTISMSGSESSVGLHSRRNLSNAGPLDAKPPRQMEKSPLRKGMTDVAKRIVRKVPTSFAAGRRETLNPNFKLAGMIEVVAEQIVIAPGERPSQGSITSTKRFKNKKKARVKSDSSEESSSSSDSDTDGSDEGLSRSSSQVIADYEPLHAILVTDGLDSDIPVESVALLSNFADVADSEVVPSLPQKPSEHSLLEPGDGKGGRTTPKSAIAEILQRFKEAEVQASTHPMKDFQTAAQKLNPLTRLNHSQYNIFSSTAGAFRGPGDVYFKFILGGRSVRAGANRYKNQKLQQIDMGLMDELLVEKSKTASNLWQHTPVFKLRERHKEALGTKITEKVAQLEQIRAYIITTVLSLNSHKALLDTLTVENEDLRMQHKLVSEESNRKVSMTLSNNEEFVNKIVELEKDKIYERKRVLREFGLFLRKTEDELNAMKALLESKKDALDHKIHDMEDLLQFEKDSFADPTSTEKKLAQELVLKDARLKELKLQLKKYDVSFQDLDIEFEKMVAEKGIELFETSIAKFKEYFETVTAKSSLKNQNLKEEINKLRMTTETLEQQIASSKIERKRYVDSAKIQTDPRRNVLHLKEFMDCSPNTCPTVHKAAAGECVFCKV